MSETAGGGGRKVFSLFGVLGITGVRETRKKLTDAEKTAKILEKQINQLGKSVMQVGMTMTKSFTAPVVGLAGAMVVLANRTGQYADKLLDLQQVTGLSTDHLQGLENVARHAGVSFDGLAGTVSKFTSRMPQIINEGGAAAGAIKALGVNTHDADGSMRDMNSLFPEMINKLQGIENVTDRNIISQQIFGRELKDMAPVLGMTSDEFNRLFGSAQDVAGYMSEDALRAANDYRIEAEKLKQEFIGFWREISMRVIPILKDTLIPMIRDTVFPVFQGLADLVGRVTDWFGGLSDGTRRMIVEAVALVAVMGPVLVVLGKIIMAAKVLGPLYMVLIKGQLGLNAAMIANPIGLIITGIGLLVAAGILLVRNWDAVKAGFVAAWDAIQYASQQAMSFMIEGFLRYVQLYVEGIGLIIKYIPGLNKAYQFASDGVKGLIDRQHELRAARKEERLEAKAQKAATEEVTDAVVEAAQATTQYNMAELNLRKEKAESVKATKEQVEAEKDMSEERARLASEWSDKLFRETATRLEIMEREKSEAIRIAEEKGIATTDIEAYYALKRQEIVDAETQANIRAAEAKGNALMGYIEQVVSGSQSIGEALKGMVIRAISGLQKNVMAEAIKAQAVAWAQSGATFGASLASLGVVAGKVLPQIGALEALKAGVRGLATGGLVQSGTGGGVFAVGEGREDEIVLPLKRGVDILAHELLDKLGAIAFPAPAPAPAAAFAGAAPGGSGGGGRPVSLHIGTLIADDAGLKKLERTLERVRIGEQVRRGER